MKVTATKQIFKTKILKTSKQNDIKEVSIILENNLNLQLDQIYSIIQEREKYISKELYITVPSPKTKTSNAINMLMR